MNASAGSDVAAVLAAIEHRYPRLAPLLDNNRIAPHYLLSLDGQRFLTSLTEPLPAGSRLLLLSADAGG